MEPSCSTEVANEINSNYVAAGFYDDCRALVNRFTESKTVRFCTFLKLWREMKFHLMYSGRSTYCELMEFGEEALRIAARFLFAADDDDSPSVLQRCVAGLYIGYCARCSFPAPRRRPTMRAAPSSTAVLADLRQYATTYEQFDLLYVLCAMLRDGAFRFVADEREYGLEKAVQQRREILDQLKPDPEKCNHLKKALSDGVLDELDDSMNKYMELKCKLPGGQNELPPKELDYVDRDFAKTLISSVQKIEEPIRTTRRPRRSKTKRIKLQKKISDDDSPDSDESDIKPALTTRSVQMLEPNKTD